MFCNCLFPFKKPSFVQLDMELFSLVIFLDRFHPQKNFRGVAGVGIGITFGAAIGTRLDTKAKKKIG